MSGTWQKGRRKLNQKDANDIRVLFFQGSSLGLRISERYEKFAKEYGVHPRTIERVIKKHTHNRVTDVIKPDKVRNLNPPDLTEEL